MDRIRGGLQGIIETEKVCRFIQGGQMLQMLQ
jgi:hypothetical protein